MIVSVDCSHSFHSHATDFPGCFDSFLSSVILTVSWDDCFAVQLSVHNIRLPKQSTVGDVINELKGKVHASLKVFIPVDTHHGAGEPCLFLDLPEHDF